jgi:class 3 adenylate cyclase
VTFIFTDIAGFTTMSEKLTSEKLSEVLNAYLDGACEIILRHEGTIDKFIGDAIMSIFNAPIPQSEHAARAVRCALELDAYAEAFRIKANAEGVPIGVTRIGVHSGPAVVGNFGSHSRMDFTALGDTVNTAARTEGVNKYFGTRICCTEEVVAQCGQLPFRPVGDVVLKGKYTAVGLFNPINEEEAQSEHYRRYMDIYALLKAEDPAASAAVRQFHQDYPDDPLGQFHFERVEKGLNTARVVMEDK